MGILLDQLIEALINIALFSAIPVIWWLIFYKKQFNFFEFVGLKKLQIKNKKTYTLAFVFLTALSLAGAYTIKSMPMLQKHSATTNLPGTGFIYIIVVLIFSFIKTGLAEEIFFRGFLAKRIIARVGFTYGNLIQSLIFGALHGIMFFKVAGLPTALIITVLISINAWLSAWINEKQSNGSILSSWLLHGLSNFIVGMLALV